MSHVKVPYVDFRFQTSEVKEELMKSVSDVLDSGMYVLGPEVQSFEEEIAAYCGSKYAVGVSNGTDALILALMAMDIGPGDEVITAPNSFIASASAIAIVGATPVFADINEDFNIDPNEIKKVITNKTKAVMPVHLTGLPARMDEINQVAADHGVRVIEDAAQSVGAKYKGKRVGSLGEIAGFSLHPLKNLHAFGDGGFITTSNIDLYEKLQVLRNLGLKERGKCQSWSYNARLDEIQAAMLRINLRNLDRWTEQRREIALRYNKELAPFVIVPESDEDIYHVHQTYVVRAQRRNELQKYLNERDISASVHYPTPIHMQEAAQELPYSEESFPVTNKIVNEILSLPLFPGMTTEQQDHVINSIKEFYES